MEKEKNVHCEGAMKSSRYNVFFEIKKKESEKKKYALLNTLSKAILAVDDDLKTVLEKGDFNTLDSSIKTSLVQMGVLVPWNLDEKAVYEFRHCITKYRSEEACFVIFPTYNCNLRCPYCYEGTEKLSAHMDDATIEKTINFVKAATVENRGSALVLGFYGGEPLLHPDICYSIARELSEWAHQNNITYFGTLTTNGTLLNEKTAELLLPYIASVHITLDGSEDMHNRMRIYTNGKGSFREVMRACELLRDTPHHLTIRLHIDLENDCKGLEVLDELEERGFKGRPNLHIYFRQLEPPDVCLSSAVSSEYVEKKKRELDEFPAAWKRARDKGWGPHMSVGVGEEHGLLTFNIIPCDHLRKSHYIVDPFGDVYMCPMAAGFKHHAIGTLKEGGVLECAPAYYTLLTRDPLQIEGCSECAYLPMCSGGCPVSIYEKTHNYLAPHCGFSKILKVHAVKSHLRHTYPEKFSEVL